LLEKDIIEMRRYMNDTGSSSRNTIRNQAPINTSSLMEGKQKIMLDKPSYSSRKFREEPMGKQYSAADVY
jgi:hypothetical protein